MKLIWCNGVAGIYGQLEEGLGSVCHGSYVHSAIHETYLVYWWCRDLPWVYGVHSRCILIYVELMQCSGFPEVYA